MSQDAYFRHRLWHDLRQAVREALHLVDLEEQLDDVPATRTKHKWARSETGADFGTKEWLHGKDRW